MPCAPRHRVGLLVLVATLAVTGCASSDTDPAPQAELPAVFVDGVPEPAGDVILTVATEDEIAEWDLETLGALDQQRLTIEEPFLKVDVTFTGPLWADVLRASGVDLDTVSSVELVALDDFVADIPTDAAVLDGLLLATAADDAAIDIADGGPIRLVFPDGNPAGENLNNWIWSIKSATAT